MHEQGEALQLAVAAGEVVLAVGALDHRRQLVEVAGRLDHVVDRPQPERLHDELVRLGPRDHDGRRPGRHRHDLAEQLRPRHLRQSLVHEHHVGVLEPVARLLSGRDAGDRTARAVQRPLDQQAVVGAVLHHEDPDGVAGARWADGVDEARAHGGSGRATSPPQNSETPARARRIPVMAWDLTT